MANPAQGRKSLNSALRFVRDGVKAAFEDALQSIRGILLAEAGADGVIPAARSADVRRRVGNIVQRIFVGEDQYSAYAADGVTPLAPYPAALNKAYIQITYNVIKKDYDWMQRNVPEDVFRFLASATRPFSARELTEAEHLQVVAELARYGIVDGGHEHHVIGEEENPFLRRPGETRDHHILRLGVQRIFAPDPNAEIDPERAWVPMHRWKDGRAYRLSDRIWRASVETRRKIDLLLAEALEEGRDVRRLSSQLEQFLLPGRKFKRTRKPYGTDASYDAMRLARSEIASAANRASYLSATLNPYVTLYDVRRSPGGDPTCPICPRFASVGIGGERLRPAYELGAVPVPIFHPFCMCLGQPIVTENPKDVSDRLRALLEDTSPDRVTPAINPATPESMLTNMLGNALLRQLVLPGF